MNVGQLRIVIADDSVLLREGIVSLLTARGFNVVGEAGDAEDLLRQVRGQEPDVALVDIRMPPTGTDDGLRAAHQIGEECPAVAVLLLSDHLEPEYATRLLEDGHAGRGYLLKETVGDADALADVVRRVAAGECVVDPAIVQRVIGRLRARDPLTVLTGRERLILGLMAEGRSNAGIAAHLEVSERTVESHVAAVFQKLELTRTVDDHRRVLAVLTFLRQPGTCP